jgi:outer membrane protein
MHYRLTCFTFLFLFTAHTAVAQADLAKRKISLEESVRQALKSNLSLQLQREDVESAKGATLSAEGKFDIYLQADAAYQNKELTPIVPGGSAEEDTGALNIEAAKVFSTGTAVTLGWKNNSYKSDSENLLLNPSYNSGLQFNVQQPLLKGFGTDIQTASLRAAEKQLESNSFLVNSEAANLAAQVKQAYWILVYAWQNIEVKKLSLELTHKLLAETEAKIEAGKLAPVEIYQPQSEVARKEELLITAERAIGTAEDNLKLLLNSDDWLTEYNPSDKPTTEIIQLDLPKILENALQNRPDIKAADLSTEAARLQLKIREDDIRPDLSLVGGLGVGGTDDDYGYSVDNSLKDPDSSWQVGITFSVPLQNRVAKGYRQQAKANLNKATTSGDLLRQEVRRSVRTTIRDIELAIKALEATRKTSLATQKRLEAEEAKFNSGRSTTLDVLAAQEAYSEALSQENLTKVTYANTIAELDRIQGLVTFTSAK